MKNIFRKISVFFQFFPFLHPQMAAPDLAGDSHRGLVRRHNEDSYIYIKGSKKTPSIAIVADGIGGHHNGDIASGLLIRLFLEKWRKYLEEGKKYSLKELIFFLDTLYLAINDAIAKINRRFGSAYPMGTTLTATLFFRDYLISHHAGDSRLYRVRNGKITQLTMDHSILLSESSRRELMEKLLASSSSENGEEKARKLKTIPKHMITKAVGTKKGSLPEFNLFRVKKADRYILCSDGLFLHLTPEDICRIVTGSAGAAKCVNTLMNTALQRGGADNVTIICAFFS